MIASIIFQVVQFYIWLIIAYVLMSWFPISGVFLEIHRVLSSIVEPYLNIFRRIIPPMGALDISPIVAILVLQVLTQIIAQVLRF
ncbi:MAG: YggT family protein [Actinobacteria bacterium HGW-Actinobacteria-7]|jgi:YggT family protein|nr:MAG: YggT family protein [Actinobacteria bacterium HGW-Actinobacteria-7]